METLEVSSRMHQKSLFDEIKELRKLRTAAMMEKCMAKNEIVVCPKPRRRDLRKFRVFIELNCLWIFLGKMIDLLTHLLQTESRQCWEQVDVKVGSELSDIIMNKASPPYYSGSPPVRANNPLIQDVRFHKQSVQQTPSLV